MKKVLEYVIAFIVSLILEYILKRIGILPVYSSTKGDYSWIMFILIGIILISLIKEWILYEKRRKK